MKKIGNSVSYRDYFKNCEVGKHFLEKNAYVDDGIPLIRSQNINNDRVDLDGTLYLLMKKQIIRWKIQEYLQMMYYLILQVHLLDEVQYIEGKIRQYVNQHSMVLYVQQKILIQILFN